MAQADACANMGTLDNVFNKPIESIQLINILFDKYPKYFNDTIYHNLYSMRAQNSSRLQDYKNTYIDDSLVISKYKYLCDSSEIDSKKDDILFYRNLANVPKMEIIKDGDCQILLKRDIAGLFNVPVIIKNDTTDFVFDTGANVSVITESLAKNMGLKLLEVQ